MNCKYHPNRNAVEKCEKCEALICLECKKVLKKSIELHQDLAVIILTQLRTIPSIFCVLCVISIKKKKQDQK